MQVQCPSCSAIVTLPDDRAGQVVNCPKCGGQMQMPAGPGAPAIAPTRIPGLGLGPDTTPRDKPCPQCGKPILWDAQKCCHCGSFMGGGPGGAPPRSGPDWEKRDQLGWFGGLVGTIKGVLFDPVRTFQGMGLYGYGPAIGYTAICGGLGMVVSALWQLLFSGVQMASMPEGQRAQFAAIMTTVYVAMAVLGPLLVILGSFVSAALIHLGLMLVHGAKQPFETTYRTIAYGAGSTAILNLVPFCGGFAAGVWALVVEIIGIAKTHDISYGKAALGVLLIPLGLGLLCGCGFVILMFTAMGAAMR